MKEISLIIKGLSSTSNILFLWIFNLILYFPVAYPLSFNILIGSTDISDTNPSEVGTELAGVFVTQRFSIHY